MATKYIVNNVTGQTITGNLTIEGNLTITGSSNSNSIATYKALLTQTGTITATTMYDLNLGFIIGEVYTITDYQNNDDFSNIANVINGNINETNCIFIATGETPTSWTNGSTLVSDGNLVVDVLENTFGYDLDWSMNTPAIGYYSAINQNTGQLINSFPRNNVQVKAQIKTPFDWFGYPNYEIFTGVGSLVDKDDCVFISVVDLDSSSAIDNALYYTPVEINIKQDLDTTPIDVYGGNVSAYPYGNVSIRLYADTNNIATIYNATYTEVTNINELVGKLNSDENTSVLGVYSVNPAIEDGVILTMATNLKNQYSPNDTLTFEVFND